MEKEAAVNQPSNKLLDIIPLDGHGVEGKLKTKMKRFKIIDPSGCTENTQHNTIEKVVNDLLGKGRDMSLQTYYVKCLIDEIEIEADELISAWREGERPDDLQMF
jgi:hypothetical protein